MMKTKLRINDKIEIVEDNVSYKSIIQDILEDSVLIYVPVAGTKYYTMHIGSRFEFFVADENEITKYGTVVVGKRREGNIYLIELSNPVYLSKVQRREYFRLPILLDAKYSILPDKIYHTIQDLPKNYMENTLDCVTVDISGGGLKIVSKDVLPRGRHIAFIAELPTPMTVICEIIRSDLDSDNKNYKTALRIHAIDPRDREKIIKFIFQKSRDANKSTRN